jgi:hypothetical protein
MNAKELADVLDAANILQDPLITVQEEADSVQWS